MILPTIHINGSSARDLLAGYSDAANAICAALEALARCAPNGRDYYVQGNYAIQNAIAEHTARANKLRDVLREIEALGEYVASY